jgi:hypothetical protein
MIKVEKFYNRAYDSYVSYLDSIDNMIDVAKGQSQNSIHFVAAEDEIIVLIEHYKFSNHNVSVSGGDDVTITW